MKNSETLQSKQEVKTISETDTKIKRLEKRKGRFWLFKRKTPSGTVTPLSDTKMANRLRNIWIYSMKTIGAYLRDTIGEKGLQEMYENQAIQYANSSKHVMVNAENLAKWTIKYNLQPQGIEATYTGNKKEAIITTTQCPLPQKLLENPEFLYQTSFDIEPIIRDFGSETITAKGEWPPKRLESCHTCLVVMPKIGEILGFSWKHELTDGAYKKCQFIISMNETRDK